MTLKSSANHPPDRLGIRRSRTFSFAAHAFGQHFPKLKTSGGWKVRGRLNLVLEPLDEISTVDGPSYVTDPHIAAAPAALVEH